jgi:hypothetical protein
MQQHTGQNTWQLLRAALGGPDGGARQGGARLFVLDKTRVCKPIGLLRRAPINA